MNAKDCMEIFVSDFDERQCLACPDSPAGIRSGMPHKPRLKIHKVSAIQAFFIV